MTGRAFEVAETTGVTNGIVDDSITTAAAFVAKLTTLPETVMAEPG